jgi:hypothetical protein
LGIAFPTEISPILGISCPILGINIGDIESDV